MKKFLVSFFVGACFALPVICAIKGDWLGVSVWVMSFLISWGVTRLFKKSTTDSQECQHGEYEEHCSFEDCDECVDCDEDCACYNDEEDEEDEENDENDDDSADEDIEESECQNKNQ
jgi:hypothetical protein